MKQNIFQSKNIIKHKWDCRVYTLDEMIDLVKKGNITKKEFFDITRYNYDGVMKNKKSDEQH